MFASKMGYYSVEDFVKQKRQREKEAMAPPRANFLAAANHIRGIFEGKKLTYGVMGGLEMLCLGYQREMPDLQIAYDDRDFHRLKAKLEADQRVRLPEGINSLFPAKILVRTGPAYKDEGCTQAADIEVDLVPPGFHGTPSGGGLTNNLVLLSQKTGGKLRSYKGLNMFYLIKTLVHYCRVRDLAWDPRKDLLFLCQHYGEDVQAIRSQLDQKAVQQSFLGTPFFSRLSSEDQRKCYQILLGTEPPPIMAITPPAPLSGHKHSASAQDVSNKPRISGHKPSPSLNAQTSPELLSPPLLGKPDSRQHASDVQVQISELPALPSSHWRTSSEQITAGRDARSRYRPISAPNSRNVSPNEAQIAVPKMKHTRQLPHQLVAPARHYQSHRASSYQLQPPNNLGPAHVGAHTPKSMPNLNAGPLPPYAFAQTPSLNYAAPNPHIYMSPAEMSATPVPLNLGQQHTKSHISVGGSMPEQRHSNLPMAEQAVPHQSRNVHQVQQEAGAELSSASMVEGQANQLRVINPGCGTNREASSQGGSQSQSNDTSSAPVELDANCPIGQFIAELSADRATPAPDSHLDARATQQPAQDHQPPVYSIALHASPTSPPDPSTSEQHVIRPLNPRTHSAPTTLPASLTPGGSSSHHRTHSTTTSDSTDVPTTNASRYSRFYAALTPPGSPQQLYKAYQPSLAPAATTLSPPVSSPERQSGSSGKQVRDELGFGGGHTRDVSVESAGSGSGSEEFARGYRELLQGKGEGYGSS